MKIIGLTGGIGSGKSSVGNLLEHKDIPIYYSDLRAHEIMNESDKIVSTLKELYGDDIYVDGKLDREKLGSIVFADKDKLAALNELVHPEVFADFDTWKKEQNSDFIIKEAAILFESGSYKNCDIVVTVSAPLETRIIRTMARDDKSREEVMDRISKQWTDEQREEKADYIIKNDSSFLDLEREVEQFYYWLQNSI
ncbi:dephospho-CoA kinase [Weeksellaceae bacterium KMM 9713]|uniref:Dephospho-CoA kinase n=1 Tax=Profundicola chukchiensis TaxID=2961959 RepID=A0A9X4MY88_9FLAO|nr:dephospho-CoA kinase [Profundicola chukchiensis]MDG4944840.1 dephospho-CoA kinase [Profundicola chukchiensis]